MENWEIVLPAEFNFFKIKTKNPLSTLQKIFQKTDEVAVSPPAKLSLLYFYISKEDFEKLVNEGAVKVTTTTVPYKGVTEAWGCAIVTLPLLQHTDLFKWCVHWREQE